MGQFSPVRPRLLIETPLPKPRPVKQSKNADLVGLGGIVILETENAFRVVTRKNKVKRTSA